MTRLGLLSLAALLGGILPLLALTPQSQPISQKAHDLHFRSIVVDTHDDTTQRLLDPKSISGRDTPMAASTFRACAKAAWTRYFSRFTFLVA
jgi:hypothetical protein